MAKFTDRIKEWWRLPEEMERDYDEADETERSTRSRRSGSSERRTSRERASSHRKYDDYRDSDYDNNDYASSYGSGYSDSGYDNDDYSDYGDYDDYGGNTETGYSGYGNGSDYKSRSDRGYDSGDYRRYNSGGSDEKVLNIAATTRLKVVCVKPKVYDDDIKNIADQIVDGYTVLINLEETPKDAIIRIIDFVSGCAYVRRGNVQRIARNIFIVTPNNVELKGDSLIGELESNGFVFME